MKTPLHERRCKLCMYALGNGGFKVCEEASADQISYQRWRPGLAILQLRCFCLAGIKGGIYLASGVCQDEPCILPLISMSQCFRSQLSGMRAVHAPTQYYSMCNA